jgi:hypothetical protein
MFDSSQPASSLQPPKKLEIPNPQSTTVAGGQDSGCEIACELGSLSREIFDSSCKPIIYIRNMYDKTNCQ